MLSSRILRVGGRGGGGFRRLWDWVGLGGVGRALRRALLFALAWLMRGTVRRVALVLLLTLGGLAAAYSQLPPLDYLPQGNRNLIFGLVKIPPRVQLGAKGTHREGAGRPVRDHAGAGACLLGRPTAGPHFRHHRQRRIRSNALQHAASCGGASTAFPGGRRDLLRLSLAVLSLSPSRGLHRRDEP